MSKAIQKIQTFWTNAAEQETDARGLSPTVPDPYLQDILETVIEKWI